MFQNNVDSDKHQSNAVSVHSNQKHSSKDSQMAANTEPKPDQPVRHVKENPKNCEVSTEETQLKSNDKKEEEIRTKDVECINTSKMPLSEEDKEVLRLQGKVLRLQEKIAKLQHKVAELQGLNI